MAYCPKCQWAIGQMDTRCPVCGYEWPAAPPMQELNQYTIRGLLVFTLVLAIGLGVWTAVRPKRYIPLPPLVPTRVVFTAQETRIYTEKITRGKTREIVTVERPATYLGSMDLTKVTEILVEDVAVARKVVPSFWIWTRIGQFGALRRLSVPADAQLDRPIRIFQEARPKCVVERPLAAAGVPPPALPAGRDANFRPRIGPRRPGEL